MKNILNKYKNYKFSNLVPIIWKGNTVYVLDQLLLPQKEKFIKCKTYQEIGSVIKNMNIRGAPAIGIAAAMGFALGVSRIKLKTGIRKQILKIKKILLKTRPTAKNLSWAIEEQMKLFETNMKLSLPEISLLLKENAMRIHIEDIEMCRKIGANGAKLMKSNFNILTHCNAGALATGDYGTALGVIRSTAKKFKNIHVYVDETRPYLQGSRLTAYELMKEGIKHTLICDNMAGYLMSQGKIDCIVIGADRIAANGDIANKIGSYALSVLAKYHNIPFYVAAPHSTFDLNIKSGNDIVIEERPHMEMKRINNKLIAPKNTNVYNPAFDIVPKKLISSIITERGVFTKPYKF